MQNVPLPVVRPRRLRRNAAIRDLVQETHVVAADLIAPLFVKEGDGPPEPVGSMPGVQRLSVADLVAECRALHGLGVRGVALFPVTPASAKDPAGTEALSPGCLVLRAVRAVKSAVPGLVLFTDIALDPYTSHGHDGILTADGSDVDNDATVGVLAKMAVLHARAGADFVAPSDMMDGRVGAIRKARRSGRRSTPPAARRPGSLPTRRSSPRPTTVRSARRSGARARPARLRSTNAPISSIPPTGEKPSPTRCSTNPRAPTCSW